MVNRTTKKPSTSIFAFTDNTGPQTAKGKANKLMTGDGRKTVKNLSKDEAADLLNGIFGVPKATGTKKKAGKTSSAKKKTTSVVKKRTPKK